MILRVPGSQGSYDFMVQVLRVLMRRRGMRVSVYDFRPGLRGKRVLSTLCQGSWRPTEEIRDNVPP